MKNLLPAIKTALQALPMVTAENIFITPDVRWRPETTGAPCIGILPAGMEREELPGEMVGINAMVHLSVFVPLTANGSDSFVGTNGLYTVLDAATAILKNNQLGQTDVIRVTIGADEPAEIYQASESAWLVRVTREILYNIERSIA